MLLFNRFSLHSGLEIEVGGFKSGLCAWNFMSAGPFLMSYSQYERELSLYSTLESCVFCFGFMFNKLIDSYLINPQNLFGVQLI